MALNVFDSPNTATGDSSADPVSLMVGDFVFHGAPEMPLASEYRAFIDLVANVVRRTLNAQLAPNTREVA